MRPLGIPTMKDRAMQALHLLALEPVAETLADPRSYGFRPERSCADAIQQCFIVLSKSYSAQWVLEGDIKACFDRISHDWLLRHIPTDTAVLKKWLKAGYMEKQKVYPTDEGTPQGGIISPVLANLALDGLQKLLKSIPVQLKKGRSPQLNLVRYADDFIITGRSKELLEEKVVPLVDSFIRERGLELSLEKTSITHISEGFDFLGQTIRKYNGKYLTKPSKKSVKVFLEKVRGIIRDNRTATAAKLIEQLNPVIKGWANYHQHVCSKATYGKVDHSIFQCLWQWAKRRHPTKPRRWIVRKYFGIRGGDRWSFYGTVDKGEDKRTLRLYKANATRIRRHVQIRGAANPYDPEWETYFEERDGLKLAATTAGRRKLSYLWREQQGICPVCQKRITGARGWNLHHMVWRTRGGSDGAENRLLLHDYCHAKAHAQAVSVVKPRSSRSVRDA